MKSLWMLFATLLFAISPAVAQHHGGGSAHGSSGGGHAVVSHESHAAPVQHNGGQRGQVEHHDLRNQPHAGYHYSGGGARGHFVGGRYDHEFFASHWGVNNRFYWGHCNWWGPRFGVGSYFWFGGGYWVIVDEIPYDWYDDEVYVEYVDGYGYALINPTFPGVYYHVGVRF